MFQKILHFVIILSRRLYLFQLIPCPSLHIQDNIMLFIENGTRKKLERTKYDKSDQTTKSYSIGAFKIILLSRL